MPKSIFLVFFMFINLGFSVGLIADEGQIRFEERLNQIGKIIIGSQPQPKRTSLEEQIKQDQAQPKKNSDDIDNNKLLTSVSKYDQAQILFHEIFSTSGYLKKEFNFEEFVLNPNVFGDLKLITGSIFANDDHISNKLMRTKTLIGQSMFSLALVHPYEQHQDFIKIQKIIKYLEKEVETRRGIQESLNEFAKKDEGLMLTLFSPNDPVRSEQMRDFIELISNRKTTSPAAQELKKRSNDFTSLVGSLAGLYGLAIGGISAFSYFTSSSNTNGLFPILSSMIISGVSVYGFTSQIRSMKNLVAIVKSKIRPFHNFLILARKIKDELKKKPQIAKLMQKEIAILTKFTEKKYNNAELNDFLNTLESKSIESDSTYFSKTGESTSILVRFPKFYKVFSDPIAVLGRIDSFLSMAQLMEETKGRNEAPFTYAEYYDHEQGRPIINLKGFWNPMLDPAKTVVNDAMMGEGAGPSNNMIITGPNAGGKSTFMTGVAVCLILAQTFGVCPAESATLTQFKKINTYMGIKDDIGEGLSLFMAELKRAKTYISELETLKNNEFAFSIIDELFTGTNPTEGEAASYAVVKKIAQKKNSMNLVASHFKKTTELEADLGTRIIGNYKVEVTKGSDGRFVYPFKVVPGIADQRIAIDLLEQEGIDKDIIEEARKIINAGK